MASVSRKRTDVSVEYGKFSIGTPGSRDGTVWAHGYQSGGGAATSTVMRAYPPMVETELPHTSLVIRRGRRVVSALPDCSADGSVLLVHPQQLEQAGRDVALVAFLVGTVEGVSPYVECRCRVGGLVGLDIDLRFAVR